MLKLCLAILTLAPLSAHAVAVTGGLRNTLSLFDEGGLGEPPGYGAGGQLRVHFADHFGTEWFYDYLTASLDPGVRRVSQHIGWAVMYYPISLRSDALLMPYIVAGHCFDYSEVTVGPIGQDRWSSAAQMGGGVQINVAPRFDVSLTSLYMVHLGTELHYDGHGAHADDHGTLEGHLLTSLSVNFHFLEF
jgi:hypothetical protein